MSLYRRWHRSRCSQISASLDPAANTLSHCTTALTKRICRSRTLLGASYCVPIPLRIRTSGFLLIAPRWTSPKLCPFAISKLSCHRIQQTIIIHYPRPTKTATSLSSWEGPGRTQTSIRVTRTSAKRRRCKVTSSAISKTSKYIDRRRRPRIMLDGDSARREQRYEMSVEEPKRLPPLFELNDGIRDYSYRSADRKIVSTSRGD